MNNNAEVTPTTTAVSVKVLENKPAVVNFNYDEISKHLDSVLVKYKNLVFTENTASDCKKTIAELRKGQKALDEFRKATKKQLTESVTVFENRCKELHSKFEEVIKPLNEQHDQFELDRKEKKRVEIQAAIDALIKGQSLNEKYAAQLVILDEYYNKGKSIKVIKSELTARAGTLKLQQDKEDQDTELIRTKVDLANAQYQLTNILMPEQYIRHLAFHSVANIEEMIISDAQQVKGREIKVNEALASKIAEIPKAKVPPKAEDTVQSEFERHKEMAEEFARGYQGVSVNSTAVAADPSKDQKLITAVYEITGTDEQLSALEAYMDANHYQWRDRPNDL